MVEMRAQAAEDQYDSEMEFMNPADQRELHEAQNEGGWR